MVVRADAGVAPAHILPRFCVWLLQAGEGHQELLRFRVTNSSVMVVLLLVQVVEQSQLPRLQA
jgi:hypothetical protein